MNALTAPLAELAEFQALKLKMKGNKGILQVSGCMESQKVHLMYGISKAVDHVFILAENDLKAKELFDDYRFYDPDVLLYPPDKKADPSPDTKEHPDHKNGNHQTVLLLSDRFSAK